MTRNYTRPKTVRFTPETWKQIEKGAIDRGITTSTYIREIIVDYVYNDICEAEERRLQTIAEDAKRDHELRGRSPLVLRRSGRIEYGEAGGDGDES